MIHGNVLKGLISDFVDCGGLFPQATQYLRQSPERGGEASYIRWDARPTWVLRKDPVGAQGKTP